MNPVMNPNQGETKRLKEFRLLKCWVPTVIDEKTGLPGFKYALQQKFEQVRPIFDDKHKPTDETVTYWKWQAIGEGDLAWAEANAKHYGITVPTDEYVLEDHDAELDWQEVSNDKDD